MAAPGPWRAPWALRPQRRGPSGAEAPGTPRHGKRRGPAQVRGAHRLSSSPAVRAVPAEDCDALSTRGSLQPWPTGSWGNRGAADATRRGSWLPSRDGIGSAPPVLDRETKKMVRRPRAGPWEPGTAIESFPPRGSGRSAEPPRPLSSGAIPPGRRRPARGPGHHATPGARAAPRTRPATRPPRR